MQDWMKLLLAGAIGYLLGSFNPAIVFSRVFKGKDIRTMGSGNAGSTNVYRNLGPKFALAVLLCDLLKGVLAAVIGQFLFAGMDMDPGLYGRFAGGLGAILGHAFPLWHGFRGGKGVVTAAGMLIVFDWRVIAVMLAVFLIFSVSTRYISLGSIMAAAALPVCMLIFHFGHWFMFGEALLAGGLVIWLHRTNIGRLVKGCESKFYFKPKK